MFQRGARAMWYAGGLMALWASAASGVTQGDVASTGGDQARLLLGSGSGVRVAVLDAGIDSNHPSLRGSLLAQRDFSATGSADDERFGGGHGTGIASLLVGHDGSSYRGFAPEARLINARIVTANDYTTDRIAGNGLFWSISQGASIVNLSIGNDPHQGPVTEKLNLMVDYAAERYGTSVVSAAGNEDASAVNYAPGGAYNGYSVGALAASRYNQVSSFSNYALRSDRRSKPDLIAPGTAVNLAAANWEYGADYTRGDGTSFAAPMVGGALAQLTGYGQRHSLSTRPALLKAIVMTAATKVWDYDGTAWAPRHRLNDPDEGARFDQPLDGEQGAGRLDARSAWQIYARQSDDATPLADWSEGAMRVRRSLVVPLGDLSAGQRVDATLTWLRHVGWRDSGNGYIDGSDHFWQRAELADFSLTLLRNGQPLITSDSDVDNLEHLSWLLKRGGDYALRVYRFGGTGIKRESWAMALRVLDQPSLLRSLGSVAPSALQARGVLRGNLATTVPEPVGGLFVLAALACTLRRRRA